MKTFKKILSVLLVCVLCLGIGVTAASAAEYIGADKAKQAAFDHAGITAEKAKFVTCEFDFENGKAIYEVEFYSGRYEYSYDINAKTGAVVKFEKDYLGASVPDGAYIGEKAAKAIAFKDAGIAQEDAQRVKVSFDFDDGVAKYEIEFHCGSYEYEYDIDALSGDILKVEKDREFSISFISQWFSKLVEMIKSFFAA